MSKETFLSRLEQLLYDIPEEEREEAMDYYRSYFEEAGAENEAAVLEELDSVQEIAASIKEDLKRPGKEAGSLKNPLQVRPLQQENQEQENPKQARQDQEPWEEKSASSGNNRQTAAYRRYDESCHDAADAVSSRYGQYRKKQGRSRGIMDRQAKFILFIILAVFSFPVWGGAVSAVCGVIGVILAAAAGLVLFSAGGVVGGIACVVIGIINLCLLSMAKGLLALGAGMLMIAAGGIGFVLLLLLCGRFLPWAVRRILDLLHKVLSWGRSMA